MAPFRPDIRPGEWRGLAAAFLTLFLVLAAHTLLETARDALFLAHVSARELPWLYIAIAALALAITRSRRQIQARLRSRRALSSFLVGSAATAVGLWVVGRGGEHAAFYALYLWSGIFGTLVTLQFWLLLGDIYTVTQAKRLYGLIAGGSIAGAVAGAGLAWLLTLSHGPGALVVAAACLLALASLGPMFFSPSTGGRETDAPLGASLRDDFRLVRKNPYLVRVGALVLVSAVTVTLVDWVWKMTVAAEVPAADLGRFFAVANVAFNLLALLVQIVVASYLFRALDAARAMAVFPILIVAGALGVVSLGGLAAVLALKGVDGALRHGVHRTGIELLFVPLEDRERGRAKAFIDVVLQRGGQALASVVILGALALAAGAAYVVGVVGLLAVVWIILALVIKPHYLNLFRSALQKGHFATRVQMPRFDVSSLETVIAALSSDNDDLVLAALDILAAQDKVGLIPALLVYHPSLRVVERTLELFVAHGRRDFTSLTDRLLRAEQPELRAAVLRVRAADPALLAAARQDASPIVVATAIVGQIAAGQVTAGEADRLLDEATGFVEPEARRAVAAAIGQMPSPRFAEVLMRLVHDIDPRVRLEAVRATGRQPDARFLPQLVGLLATRLRNEARAALLDHGDAAMTALYEALHDDSLPHAIRRHIPRSLSLFPPEKAGPLLLAHLEHEPDGMIRYKILRGLGRMRASHPGLALDAATLERVIGLTTTFIRRLARWRRVLEGKVPLWEGDRPPVTSAVQELLVALLRDKQAHAVERLFRLLGLAHPGEDFQRIYEGIVSADARVRAQSLELLSNVLPRARRDEVLALIDDAPGRDEEPVRSYAGIVEELLRQPSETVCALAAYHAAEVGLTVLRGQIAELRERPSRVLPEVAGRALDLLDHPAQERSAHGR